MSREAMKQALEALDNLLYWDNGKPEYDEARVAITALRQALEQPAYPVVGTKTWFEDGKMVTQELKHSEVYKQPAAQWVGLTEDEINKLRHLVDWTAEWSYGRFAYEIEQALKEKNT